MIFSLRQPTTLTALIKKDRHKERLSAMPISNTRLKVETWSLEHCKAIVEECEILSSWWVRAATTTCCVARPSSRCRRRRAGGADLLQECSLANYHTPNMSWIFLKGRDSWKRILSGRLALSVHCGAASFDLIVNGTPSFFKVARKKGITGPQDPSGNVTDPCEVKWIYVLRRRYYFNRRSALLFRNVDGLS